MYVHMITTYVHKHTYTYIYIYIYLNSAYYICTHHTMRIKD